MERCEKCNGKLIGEVWIDSTGGKAKYLRCINCGDIDTLNGRHENKLEILEYRKNVEKVKRLNSLALSRIALISSETDVLEDSNREMLGGDADYLEAAGIYDIGNK